MDTIQIKRHTSTSTSYLSHVLAEGELFYDFRSNKFYIGDGATAINALAPISGLMGPTGPTGQSGKDGKIGPTGPTGPQGSQGPRGETGKDGTGVNIKTSSQDCTKIGDAYIDSNGILQVLTKIVGTSKTFTAAGAIKGPKGDTGPTGPQGPQGTPGVDGKNGTNGKQGPQGEQGPTGPAGTGIELKPSRSACTKVGDAYIDSDGVLWFLSALPSTFTRGGKIEGPKGDTGDTGPSGPTGPQGEQGPTGPTGNTGTPGENGRDGKDGDGRQISLNGSSRGTTAPLSFYAPEHLTSVDSSTASSLAIYKNDGTVSYINPPTENMHQSYMLQCGGFGNISWKPEYNYFEYNPDSSIKTFLSMLLSTSKSTTQIDVDRTKIINLYNSLENAVLSMNASMNCAQCYIILGDKVYSGEINRPLNSVLPRYGLCLHEVHGINGEILSPCIQFNLSVLKSETSLSLNYKKVSIDYLFDKGNDEYLIITYGSASANSTKIDISSQIIRGESY